MFLRRCACVEPSDPTNDTLKYWARTNVTASEIYWEALEVKVQPSLERMLNAKTADKSDGGWKHNVGGHSGYNSLFILKQIRVVVPP